MVEEIREGGAPLGDSAIYSKLKGDLHDFPKLGTNLVAALTGLEMDDFSHGVISDSKRK